MATRMNFSIRDLLWLTVVVALALGWLDQFGKRNLAENQEFRAALRLNWLMTSMHESGYRVSFDDRGNSVTITPSLSPLNSSGSSPNSPKSE